MSVPKEFKIELELLDWITTARDQQGFEVCWYLDLKNNEVLNDMASEMEDEEFTAFVEGELEENDRFLDIPARETHDAWQWMQDYINQLETNDTTLTRLEDAIHGRGAFGRFHDVVAEEGLWDDWHNYKEKQEKHDALEWLHREGLIEEADIARAMEHVEERNAERQLIEEQKDMMVAGATVRCLDKSGHGDKLTEGHQYKILAERPNDLLIRIIDDRGKEVWIPKSHFCLVQ